MPTQVQRRRGTTAQHATFTGAVGELTVDTDKKTVVVHDGSTAGGVPLLRQDYSNSTTQLAGMRNKIINGKMEIAQRGTSFPAIAAGAYSVDRWLRGGGTSSAVFTHSQSSDVPSAEFSSSLRVTVTTADTSIAITDQENLQQVVEGFNAADLTGRTFTLSFWVRSSKTGIHCVSFGNAGQDRSYVSEYTINSANTWEFKTITVSGGLITAGTWDRTNGTGLRVLWCLAAGSNFQTTAGAWQTGNFLATANQVNCLDTVGNIFAITGVQLEVGSAATPFEHRPYGVELALCQRYFEQISIANTTTSYFYAGSQNNAQLIFKVSKRAAPSIAVTYNVNTAAPAHVSKDFAMLVASVYFAYNAASADAEL